MGEFNKGVTADAFFTASAQQWPAGANRQCTVAWSDVSQVFSVGPVSNTNGTLSAPTTINLTTNGQTCQRALTVANNVAIDVLACSQVLSAVNIANQIAAKVPT